MDVCNQCWLLSFLLSYEPISSLLATLTSQSSEQKNPWMLMWSQPRPLQRRDRPAWAYLGCLSWSLCWLKTVQCSHLQCLQHLWAPEWHAAPLVRDALMRAAVVYTWNGRLVLRPALAFGTWDKGRCGLWFRISAVIDKPVWQSVFVRVNNIHFNFCWRMTFSCTSRCCLNSSSCGSQVPGGTVWAPIINASLRGWDEWECVGGGQ